MKKPRKSQIISKLVVNRLLSTIALPMRCVMGRDNIDAAPDWGYCASQGLYYYGYKLHAVCGIRGVIHSYDMPAASVHDLHYLKDECWEYRNCMMLGDKGYLSTEV